MKRKVIFILSSMLVFIAAVYYYIDTVFLPIQLKNYVITKSEKYLGRLVSIRSLDFSIFRGFVVQGIKVARKDNSKEPFIEVEEVSFHLLLAPFFQNRAVIIPEITIVKPFLYIARAKDRSWNFSDLVDLKDEPKRRKLPAVLLRKLNLENGEFYYREKNKKQDFTEYFTDISLNSTLSLNKGVRFVVGAKIPKHKSTIHVKGNYGIDAKRLSAQISLNNIRAAEYFSVFGFNDLFFHLNEGVMKTADLGIVYQENDFQMQGSFVAENTDIDIDHTKKITGSLDVSNLSLTWDREKWNAAGLLQIPTAVMTSASGRKLQGDVVADLKIFTVQDGNITSQGNVSVDNALLRLDENLMVKGNIKASNTLISTIEDTIYLKGDLDIEDAFLTISPGTSVQGGLSTKETEIVWSAPDKNGNRKLTVDSGLNMKQAEILLKGNRSIKGQITALKFKLVHDNNRLSVESQGQLANAEIQLNADQSVAGEPHFNITYVYEPKAPHPVDYKGSLHFAKARMRGAPYFQNVQFEGIITATPDNIETERLTLNTRDAEILLSGKMTGLDNPDLNVNFSSNKVPLNTLFTVFPALRDLVQFDVSGLADINASYTGSLASPAEAEIKATALVTGATISHSALEHDINDVSGRFNYKTDLLTWIGLNARYNESVYILSGQVSDFSRPVVNSKVKSDKFELTAQIKILNRAFQFNSLIGKYLNTEFDLKGDMHLFEDADPDIDLRGSFAVQLSDAGELVPRLNHRVEQFKPKGILSGEGIFKGKLRDWRNWQLTFDATSDNITVSETPFTNLSIRYDQRDLNISNCNLSAVLYGGELTATSTVDLIDDDAAFAANINLSNLDLAEYRGHRKPKNKLLTGTLNFSTRFYGKVANWRDTAGDGSIHITDSHIWQWNILKGLSGALLIPEFQSMVFTEADADFTIHDQKIHTKNARMKSKVAILDGVGWIDFNKNLHFNIAPTFSEIAILQSKSKKKGPTSIITQTKDYLNIKLTGTLDNPKYTVEKFPLKILEETIGGTTGTLKEVIGGIVEEIF